jgi:TonB family protein
MLIATPAATATPAASPNQCNRPVSIAKIATPNLSTAFQSNPKPVVIEVLVTADGAVEQTRLLLSSGDKNFDEAILSSAQHSIYSPAQKDCVKIAGRYLFHFGR